MPRNSPDPFFPISPISDKGSEKENIFTAEANALFGLYNNEPWEDIFDGRMSPIGRFNDSKELFQDLHSSSLIEDFEFEPKTQSILSDVTQKEISINNETLNDSKSLNGPFRIVPDGHNESFIKISSLSEDDHLHSVDQPSCSKSFESKLQVKKRVGSLKRKSNPTECVKWRPAILKRKNKSPVKENHEMDPTEFAYYTGFLNSAFGIAVFKAMKITPTTISVYKMFMLTLMKLRLDLEWTDLGYRFQIKEDECKRVFKVTVDALFNALKHFRPEQAPVGPEQRVTPPLKVFYVHNLTYVETNVELQILIIFSHGPKPVAYITKSYQKAVVPILIILNECKDAVNMMPNDLVYCDNGRKLYSITATRPYYKLVSRPTLPSQLLEMESIANEFKKFKFIQNFCQDFDPKKSIAISAAITNLNTLTFDEHHNALFKLGIASSQ